MRQLATMLLLLGIALAWNSAFSADMQDYGKIWKAWGKDGQTAYVWGFVDGGGYALQTVMGEIIASDKRSGKVPKTFYENIRVKTATLYDESKIIDISTNTLLIPTSGFKIWCILPVTH